MSRRSLLTLHRWLGLIAGLWLLTLGVTGIFLDHDEWRWLRQVEVPENWLSPSMRRKEMDRRLRAGALDDS